MSVHRSQSAGPSSAGLRSQSLPCTGGNKKDSVETLVMTNNQCATAIDYTGKHGVTGQWHGTSARPTRHALTLNYPCRSAPKWWPRRLPNQYKKTLQTLAQCPNGDAAWTW
jgi:hypothetical protein